MNPYRRRFLMTATAALLAGGPALAQDDAATRSVIRQLEAQGFEIVSVRRTLLGRVRVLSQRGSLRREIVLDPRNGAILRDFSVDESGNPSVGPAPEEDDDGVNENGGHSDDDDDDGEDDDGDDDSSDDDSSEDDGDDGDDDGGDDDDD